LKVTGIALDGEMVSYQIAKSFSCRFNIVSRGKGAHNCHFYGENRTGWKIPNIVWVFQGLLADIVVFLLLRDHRTV